MTSAEKQETAKHMWALAHKGQALEAIERLDQLIAEEPSSFYFPYIRTVIVMRNSLPNLALKAAEDFVRQFPASRDGQLILATAYLRLEKPEEALRHVEAAEAMGGPSEQSRAQRVDCRAMMGDVKGANQIADFDASLPDPGAVTMRSKKQFNVTGDEKEMLEDAARIRTLGARGQVVATDTAHWYVSFRMFAQAEKVLTGALSEFPGDQDLMIELSKVEFWLGKKPQAIRRMREVFDRNPANSIAGKILANYYLRHLNLVEWFRILKSSMDALARIHKK